MSESSTGTKVLGAIALGITIALACKLPFRPRVSRVRSFNCIFFPALIASLPLNLPSNQQAAPVGGNGDIAWMIVATVFGLFLSPALAYLYSKAHAFIVPSMRCLMIIFHLVGLLNGSHFGDLLKTVLVSSSVITFVWVLFR